MRDSDTGKNITFVDGNFIMKNSNIDVFWGSVEEKYEDNELHPITKRMDSIIYPWYDGGGGFIISSTL